jgi:hypothetical protein
VLSDSTWSQRTGDDARSASISSAESLLAAVQESSEDTNLQLGSLSDCKTFSAAVHWLNETVPCLPLAIGPQLASTLMNTPLRKKIQVPESMILDAGLAFLLRGTSAELWHSEPWTPLYKDSRDGRSFSCLLHSMSGYPGNCMLIIRTLDGAVFGAISKSWNDGGGAFTGGLDCYLFALAPSLIVCKPSGSHSNFMYINYKNRQQARGIGFGGKVDWFRLWLDDDLGAGYVLQNDMTYQRHALLPGSEFRQEFQVSFVELWGCGPNGAKADHIAWKKRLEDAKSKNPRGSGGSGRHSVVSSGSNSNAGSGRGFQRMMTGPVDSHDRAHFRRMNTSP